MKSMGSSRLADRSTGARGEARMAAGNGARGEARGPASNGARVCDPQQRFALQPRQNRPVRWQPRPRSAGHSLPSRSGDEWAGETRLFGWCGPSSQPSARWCLTGRGNRNRNDADGGPAPRRRLTAFDVREGDSLPRFWFTIPWAFMNRGEYATPPRCGQCEPPRRRRSSRIVPAKPSATCCQKSQ